MVISTVSLKGGAGKTTISINLAVEYAHRNQKVILVDADPNNLNTIKWNGIRPDDLPFINTVSLTDPGALRKSVPELEKQCDYVIIDGTPALENLTGSIMIVSDLIILPLRSSTFDIWAFIEKFLPKMEETKSLRPDLDCRILRNSVNKRKSINREVLSVIDDFELPIMESIIGDRTVFEVSPMEGKGVKECKDSDAANEIRLLANECSAILERKLELV